MQPVSLHYFSCSSISVKNVVTQVAYYHYPNYSCLPNFLYYHPYLFLQFSYLFGIIFCGHFRQWHQTVAEGHGQGLTVLTCKHTAATISVKGIVEGSKCLSVYLAMKTIDDRLQA